MTIPIETDNGRVRLMPSGNLVCLSPDSTAIANWVYLTDKKVLAVKWGTREYHYRGVPFSVVYGLMSADSVGAFMNKEVKPKYEAEEMV